MIAASDFRAQLYLNPAGSVTALVTGTQTGTQAEATGGLWWLALIRAVAKASRAMRSAPPSGERTDG